MYATAAAGAGGDWTPEEAKPLCLCPQCLILHAVGGKSALWCLHCCPIHKCIINASRGRTARVSIVLSDLRLFPLPVVAIVVDGAVAPYARAAALHHLPSRKRTLHQHAALRA
jgi:hypothetical protein